MYYIQLIKIFAAVTQDNNININGQLITVLVGAISGFIAAATTNLVNLFFKQQETDVQNRLKYLNPLRLALEETYNRIYEIKVRLEKRKAEESIFMEIKTEEIFNQNPDWFIGNGCYLISTCYLIACLFYQIRKVREDLAYLKLAKGNDTTLWQLMFRVNRAFAREYGVYYVTQYSIGNDIHISESNRVMAYREFCELIRNKEKGVWLNGLLNFSIETGKGKNEQRLDEILDSIISLSRFLEKSMKSDASIKARMLSEELPFSNKMSHLK